MESYYQVDITLDNDEKIQLRYRYETMMEAITVMRFLLACPEVDSAILGHYSNVYPTGYDVICSIKNKTSLRGRKM